ncbi:NEW3 domain-containing protein [Conexibacter stalactiti]|uniref:NEW3 domain-containing protein n=1 Tax=Conexibacter stalactiti TaxID=1940611 RepID=A0ABU4HKT2_9ACTN|nr:NEW3 domain-containing protein [Conexibacter stalactiti]MDW5593919.1 NEW3 domain-containing protein [Conexibacter stalactiti]MEC5034561.1 NEW3 domain-containing protein [Conexibacter stalactiti]
MSESARAVVEQPFVVRYSANDNGGIWVTGDTLMTCPAAVAGCAAAQAGTASGAALNNNGYAMGFVDVDGDPATFNSSTSTYAPPVGSSVLFAGLYWGGRVSAGSGGLPAATPGARGSVLLRGPGLSAWTAVNGAVADSSAVPGAYSGFADVTALVQAGGVGQWSVANVQAGTGLDRYAGWGLVVVFRSASQPLRNLTVFDGLAAIQQGDPPLSLTVSGFVTPQAGAVRTAVGLIAYEGDRGSAGDRALLGGQPLTDAANPASNLFNSSISAEGVDTGAARAPGYVNQLGFDADRIVTNGLIANGATSATLELSTTLDQYLTPMVSLTTELSAPLLSVTKSVVNVTRGGGGASGAAASPGDLLRYTVTVSNTGDDAAADVVVSDPAPGGTAASSPSAVSLGTIAPGGSASAVFEVVVGAGVRDGDQIVNVASAAGRGVTAGQPVSGASGEVRTVVQVPVVPVPVAPVAPVVPDDAGAPPISVVTEVTPSPPVVGEPVLVRSVLANETSAPIADVVVTVAVPGARLLSASVEEGRCVIEGAIARCAVGTLDPGERVVLRVRAVPRRAGALLRPVVTVRGDGIATRRIVVRGAGRVARPAALRVTKRASVRRARPGEVVSYAIVVRSVGGVAARGVRVCDVAGPGVELLSIVGSVGTVSRSSTRVCWKAARALAPGRALRFGVDARVGGERGGAGVAAELAGGRLVSVANVARAVGANVAGGRVATARVVVRVVPLRPGPCAAAAAGWPGSPTARAAC